MDTKTPAVKLPEGVIASDLKWPKWDGPETEHLNSDVADNGQITLYEVLGFGWVVATLGISKGGKYADRTYGVKVEDGSVVRVGKGPHVKNTITLYIRKHRTTVLQKYVDLYNSGLEKAGVIRDRISTRRAQGALRRGGGFGLGLWA